MKVRPEELQENGYILLDHLNHQELVPFIQTYIRKWTKFSVIYREFDIKSRSPKFRLKFCSPFRNQGLFLFPRVLPYFFAENLILS